MKQTPATEERDFTVYCEAFAFEKAGDDKPMRIGGICSTAGEDLDGERILQEGLDFSPFLERGWYNDNHSKKTTGVLGYPTEARYVRKGEKLPTGDAAKAAGWWTEGYLLNTEEGRRVFNLAQALHKSPRRLGFSIEGKVVSRDEMDDKTIRKAVVRHVAVTHCPVNTDTGISALSKALSAGSAIASGDLNTGAGDGASLRVESLDRDEEDEETPEEVDPVVKADVDRDFRLEPTTEVGLVQEWAGAIGAELRRPTVTNSEAEMIVKARFPNMNDRQIAEITNFARTA